MADPGSAVTLECPLLLWAPAVPSLPQDCSGRVEGLGTHIPFLPSMELDTYLPNLWLVPFNCLLVAPKRMRESLNAFVPLSATFMISKSC